MRADQQRQRRLRAQSVVRGSRERDRSRCRRQAAARGSPYERRCHDDDQGSRVRVPADRRVAVTGVAQATTTAASRLPALARPRVRGLRGQPERRRGRGRPRYHYLGRSRAASRRSSSATSPDTPRRQCASAPSWASGTSGCTARSGAESVSPAAAAYGREHGIPGDRRRVPVHVRADRRPRAQVHALRLHRQPPRPADAVISGSAGRRRRASCSPPGAARRAGRSRARER